DAETARLDPVLARASGPLYPSTEPPKPEPSMIRPHHQISLFGLLVAAACGGGVPRGELPPPAPALAAGDTACLIAAGRPASRDSSLARAVMVPDDRVLSIDPSGLSFQRFADPALAVTKSAPGGGWPIGTGHYWTTGSAGGAEALWASPVPGTGLPALKVTVAPASEARDAVDANADLLLTSDPAALDYGRTRSEYQDVPLGWDHTYVLLAPDGTSLEL